MGFGIASNGSEFCFLFFGECMCSPRTPNKFSREKALVYATLNHR